MSAQVHHLRPTTALAERAILCGDPARCLALATTLVDRPIMLNHARGLWGYTGTAPDGEPLSIQATGLGAASAAIITDELCRLGLRTFVRVGTARALPAAGRGRGLAPGTAVAVTGALPADGPSRTLGATGTVLPDPGLTAGLTGPGVLAGLIASADLPHPAPAAVDAWAAAGALATDLQTAAVLQVARVHGAAAAAILVITGPVGDLAPDLDEEAHLAAVKAAAHVAAHALGLPERTGPPLPPPRDGETTGD